MGNMILAAAKNSSSFGSYSFLLIIVAVLVLMYFVTIRPQRNRQRRVMQTQQGIQPGQRVRTTAGMYATVVAVEGDDLVLEPSPGVEMRFMRRAVMEVLPDEDAASGYDQAQEYADAGESEAEDEAQQESDVTAEAGDGEAAAQAGTTVADTAGEAETTDEAGAAPSVNGKSPADKGRPAGR